MSLSTTFFILGVIYFAISIISILVLFWWILVHYFSFKEQLERMKSKLSVVINLKDLKKSPIVAGLLIPIIAYILKNLSNRRKKKA